MNDETWRVIPDFPRYQASNHGRIKGPRYTTFGSITKRGYMRTNVVAGECSKLRELENPQPRKEIFVHRLIAETFIPNPDQKPFVNHIDSNRSNNHASNLEWVTHIENFQHAWENSPVPWGREGSAAVMTPDDIQSIRRAYMAGDSAATIAANTGRKYHTVAAIVKRRNWRHLPWPT